MFRKGLKTFGIIMMVCLMIVGMFPGSLAAEEIPEAAGEETVTVSAVESETETVDAAEETTTEEITEEVTTEQEEETAGAELSAAEVTAAADDEETVSLDVTGMTESAGAEGAALLGSQMATTRYQGQTGPAEDPVSTPAATPESYSVSEVKAVQAKTTKVKTVKPKKKKPTPKINIKKKKITIKKGTKKKLAFKVKYVSKKKIKWSSSNKKVATVNSKGVVRVKSGGKCIITARIKGTDIKDSIVVKGRDYYYMRVRTTGYCNCRRCAGPWAGCRTASGRYPRANHTIAVDRRRIKLGTRVKIGKITYVAEDTGSGVRGRTIDIYYKSHSKASRHGVKWRTAKVYF